MSGKVMIRVDIELRGLFRQYAEEEFIGLTLPIQSSLGQLKSALGDEIKHSHPDFYEQEVLENSAFAKGDTILRLDYLLMKDTVLTILPPVCGG